MGVMRRAKRLLWAAVLPGLAASLGAATTYQGYTDPDSDGACNRDEYSAGTDPLDPDSVLIIRTLAAPGPGACSLCWPGVSGKVYSIEVGRDPLLSEPVTNVAVRAETTGPQCHSFAAPGAGPLCVRIGITP